MIKPKNKPSKVVYWNCDCGDTKVKGPKKITIIAIRHGESEHNTAGVVNGDPKKPYHLTPKGRKQAAALAQKLKSKHMVAIIASEMPRTQETAAPLAKIKDIRIQVDKRLNDIHAGGLEGIQILEFRKLTNEIHKSIKGSETNVGVAKRLKSFIQDLMDCYSGHTVTIVGSEIILHSLKQVSLGLPCDEAIGRHARNGTVYTFHLHNPICCPSCGDRCKI